MAHMMTSANRREPLGGLREKGAANELHVHFPWQRDELELLHAIFNMMETMMAAIDDMRAGFVELKQAVADVGKEMDDLLDKHTKAIQAGGAANEAELLAMTAEMKTLAADLKASKDKSDAAFPDTVVPTP